MNEGLIYMKTIVFIGSQMSGTSRDALVIAKEMGYFIVLMTDRNKFMLKNKKFPEIDRIIVTPHLLNKDYVISEIHILQNEGKEICACISFIDPFVSFAARISEELGLVKLSVDALSLMEDKTRFREKLNSLSSAPFFSILQPNKPVNELVQKYEKYLPFILKPAVSNGSKDVKLIETKERFREHLTLLKKKYSKEPLLIEEYLKGPQYLIEIIVYNGQLTIIGIIEQEITNNGAFIVTGYGYPAILEEEAYKKLLFAVTSIIHEIGLENGSCHLEMRIVQSEWKLIEINPRMSGGVMNRVIEEGTGINLVKEVLKMYLGGTPSLIKSREQYVYAHYITVRTKGRLLKVTGENHASEHEGVKYVFIKPVLGSVITDPYSMGNRYACIIATADNPEKVKQQALAAAKEIKFYLEPL
jgi:biotin carboxylase